MRSKGKPILHARIKKALYGLPNRALLFYRELVEDHEAYGFRINPHDLCVTSKTINDKNMTVAWHVDELKVLYVDSFEVNKFVGYLSSILVLLLVYREKIRDHLGIELY